MNALEYPLYRSQRAVLSAIIKAVSDGYGWHTVGKTRPSRINYLVEHLHKKHYVLLMPQQQYLRRKAGLPVARLFLSPNPDREGDESTWWFALMGNKKLPGEQMFEVTDGGHPLIWRKIYQLYLRENGDWSWRLCAEKFEQDFKQIELQARTKQLRELNGLLFTLSKLPMFGGVYEDLQRLLKVARRHWGEDYRPGSEGKPNWARFSRPYILPGSITRYYVEDPVEPRTLGDWLARNLQDLEHREAALKVKTTHVQASVQQPGQQIITPRAPQQFGLFDDEPKSGDTGSKKKQGDRGTKRR